MAGKLITNRNHDGLDLELLASRDDPAESRTVASRKRLRDLIANDVDRYLQQGGAVEVVDTSSRMNSQGGRPGSGYGGRPI